MNGNSEQIDKRLAQAVEGFTDHLPSEAALAKIRMSLNADLTPVRPRGSIQSIAGRFFAAFVLFAAPVAAILGTHGARDMSIAQLSGIGAALLTGAVVLSTQLAWQVSPGSLPRFSAGTALALVAGGFALGTAILFPWTMPEAFLKTGLPCLRAGLAVSLPSSALFAYLARRGYLSPTNAAGAVLGALAGLLGSTVLQVECERLNMPHLMVWHGGILALPCVLGWLCASLLRRLQAD